MSESIQKIKIGNQEYEFYHHAKDNSHTFIVDNNQFKFKRWTWGEKNRITNECVTFNPTLNQFEVDTVAFNEKMLSNTLIEMHVDSKKVASTLDIIRDLKASLGDQLLMIAQWVNSIDSIEDKESSSKVSAILTGESTYEVHLNGDVYKLKTWTWGEKNRVTNQSIKFDPESGQLRMDLQTFNELLLLATVQEARFNGKSIKLNVNFFRNLDATIGDKLLEIAQQVNEITDTEKKN